MNYSEREEQLNKRIIKDYLRFGSVEEVFRRSNFDLPISTSGVHRLIDKWGVVKAAGPNTELGEVIMFLEKLAREKIPLETLYSKLPPSFETSKVTLHRVLSCIKHGLVRRVGVGLVVTPEGDESQMLIGRDISTPRAEFGKYYGNLSIPVGFSKKGESRQDSLTRVLQREVFSALTVEREFPYELLDGDLRPFMQLYLADTVVSIYHLEIPYQLAQRAESWVLSDLRFEAIENVLAESETKTYRSGVFEVAKHYIDFSSRGLVQVPPLLSISDLNLAFNPALARIYV